MNRYVFRALVVAAVLVPVPIAALLAHGGATGVVKERMTLMTGLGDSVKALAAMMRGETAYDASKVKALASDIAAQSGAHMTKKFPEGSIEGPTEATPRIWQDWQTFEALAQQLEAYAGALQQAADNPRGAPLAGSGMMGGNSMMMGGGMMQGGGMMMGQGVAPGGGPTPEHLASMPPDAAFMHITQTCSSCHEQFRMKKQ